MKQKAFKNKLFILVCTFLKENRILEKYCYNAVMYHKIDMPENIKLVEKTRIIFDNVLFQNKALDDVYSAYSYSFNFMSLFETAFDWAETPEGIDFWFDVSDKWRNYWKENINKYENMRNI